MSKRNSYLTGKAMNNCLFASILTMCASQLNVTADGIIVSHFVNPNALSATSLFTPISLVIVSLGSLLGIGATILAARLMGQRRMEDANRAISTAVVSVVVVGVCFGLLSFLFRDAITDLICSEEALKEFFRPYMTVMSGFAVITMLSSLASQMVEVDGHPELVTKAVCVNVTTNIVLDFIFVYFFHWGITGSAVATMIATCLNVVLLSRFIFSPRSSYVVRPVTGSSWRALADNMKYGTSLIVGNMALAVMFMLLNSITQEKQGVSGMFALSVCMNLLSIGMMVSNGVGTALMSIGCFMFGQNDMKGLNFLVNRSIVMLEAAVIAVAAVATVCPSLISGLFGADSPDLRIYTNGSLQKFVWMLPTILLALLVANVYQILGRLLLSPVIVLAFPLTLIPSMLVVPSVMGDDKFWYSFPVGGVALLLVVICASALVCMKEKGRLHPLTLIPKNHANIIYDESVGVDRGSVARSVANLRQALHTADIPSELGDSVLHCVEELELNVADHAGEGGAGKYFDVLVSLDDDKIHASLKDKGRPFNPALLGEEKRRVGLNILFRFSDEVDYKFMFGQNLTIVSWNRKQETATLK